MTQLSASNTAPARRVLIVDDSCLSRGLMSLELQRHGFAVVDVDCAERALPLLAGTPFDLVVIDIVLPGMSGNTLCQNIRASATLADLPLVAYTAHSDLANRAQMRLAGFNDVLYKPIARAAVDRVLAECGIAG